jgi:VanZ family protein
MSGDSTASFPSRRHLAGFVAGYCIFLLYGTMIPFEPRALSISEAASRYMHAFSTHWRLHRIDLGVNLLLLVPLGFAAMGVWLRGRRSAAAIIAAAVGVIACCAAFSFAVEFVQVWLPARVSSPLDIATNTIGAAAGVVLWVMIGDSLLRHLQQYFQKLPPIGLLDRALHAYVAAFAVLYILPLDPIEQATGVYRAYRSGRLGLSPLMAAAGPWMRTHAWTALLVAPAAVWAVRLAIRHGKSV